MMTSIVLTIFLEGDRDKIIFDHKIKRIIEYENDIKVELIEYSQKDKKFVNTYIDTLNRTPTIKKYIFLADLDNKTTIKKKIRELISVYNKLDQSRLVIICREIEGWYLGGLSRNSAQILQLDLKKYDLLNPNLITKSQFLKLKPKHIQKSRIFYILTAKNFEKLVALGRNTSFNTFNSILVSIC